MDQLLQGGGQILWLAAAHQLLGQHPADIGQARPGAGLQGIHGGGCIKVIQRSAGQWFAKLTVHD